MSLRMQAQLDLEAILEACEMPGFKLIMEEYELMLDHSQKTAADVCDTTSKWFQRRGEIATMRFILDAKGQAEAALKNLPDYDEVTPRNPLED